MVGKVLRLTSFSFPIDDIEVHLHRSADVFVPILRDLNKKHVLEGRSCHQPHGNNVYIPIQGPMHIEPARLKGVRTRSTRLQVKFYLRGT